MLSQQQLLYIFIIRTTVVPSYKVYDINVSISTVSLVVLVLTSLMNLKSHHLDYSVTFVIYSMHMIQMIVLYKLKKMMAQHLLIII